MRSSLRTSSARASRDVALKGPAGLTRLLAWLVPTAAALGSNLPGVGPLFGFRVLTLIVAALALAYPAERSRGGISAPLALLAAVWSAAGLLLSLVAIDGAAAFRTMVSVSLGLLLAMAAVRVTRSEPRFVAWVAHGWLLSFAITSTIAAWELSSGQHLANYFAITGGVGSDLPAATFFNPNAFAVYLVSVQAMVLWVISRTRRPSARFLLYASSLWCAFLIVATGSRLCLAAFVLLTLCFLALDRLSLTRSLVVSAVVGGFVWFAAPSVAVTIDAYIPNDVRSTSVSQVLQAMDQTDTSEGRRIELYKASFWLLGASGGIGVGPGNFGAALDTHHVPYGVGVTRSPHNFVAELAVEFGVAVLIGFGLLMWSIIRRVIPHKGPERSVLLATGLAFLPASLANSGYLLSSNMWAFFATMLCMVALSDAKATK